MSTMSKKVPLWRRSQEMAPYLFSSPFIILFLTFMLYPFLYMVYLGFTTWSGFGEKELVGAKNFIFLLNDKVFWQTLINGFVIFFMYVPEMLIAALIVAVFLNQKTMKLKGAFRTFIYLPNITNIVAVSFVFVLLFSNQGFINSTLIKLGLAPVEFLSTAFGARAVIAGLTLWRWLGYNMVIMLSGLQNISDELYEAAYIDGATKVQSFTRITLPLMKPIIVFTTILSTNGTFSLIAEPQLITEGNPGNKTLSTTLYMYNESFLGMNFGYASAVAFAYFIFMMILALMQLKVSASKD